MKTIQEVELSMETTTYHLSGIFRGFRTHGINTDILAHIKVELDGYNSPLEQVALLSLVNSSCIKVESFSPDWVAAIEKAILDAKVGEVERHKTILMVRFPTMSRELKLSYVKKIKEAAEQQKVAIRNIRRDARSKLEGMEKEIEELTKEYIRTINDMVKNKTSELLK